MKKPATHPATGDQPTAQPMSDQQAQTSASPSDSNHSDPLSGMMGDSSASIIPADPLAAQPVYFGLLRDKRANIEANKSLFTKIERLQPPTGLEKHNIKGFLQDYLFANVSAQIEECQIYSRHLFQPTQQTANFLKCYGLSMREEDKAKADSFCRWFYKSLLPNDTEPTAESEIIKLAGNYLIDCLYLAKADEPTACFDIDIIQRLEKTFSPCFIDSVSYYEGIRHEYMKAKAMGNIGDQKQDITAYCNIMIDEAQQFEKDSLAELASLCGLTIEGIQQNENLTIGELQHLGNLKKDSQPSDGNQLAAQQTDPAPLSDQQPTAGKAAKPKREKTQQIKLNDEQQEKLKSFFTAPFRGMGRNEDYCRILIEDLQKRPYNKMQFAAIAFLIYYCKKEYLKSNSTGEKIGIWTADKPTTFAKWYEAFCNILGIEKGKYKPTMINDYLKSEKAAEINFYYLKIEMPTQR